MRCYGLSCDRFYSILIFYFTFRSNVLHKQVYSLLAKLVTKEMQFILHITLAKLVSY